MAPYQLSDEDKEEIRRLYLYEPSMFMLGASTFAKEASEKYLPEATVSAIRNYLETRFPYSVHRQPKMRKRHISRHYFDYEHKLGGLISADTLRFGNYYIVVYVDVYSRRLFTYPFRSLSASKVAQTIRQVREELGDLEVLHTDRGTEWMNKEVAALATELAFKQVFTTSQQVNKTSIAER